jgi:hypothetical protein
MFIKAVGRRHQSDPVAFIRGLDRVIIDEVQRAPEVLLAIKESATMRSVSFRNLTSRLREKISGSMRRRPPKSFMRWPKSSLRMSIPATGPSQICGLQD